MALEIGKTYYIKNVATGKYLNVYGTDTVANSRNVNTYAKEDCLAQKWTVGLYGNGARVYTAINSAYALNINTSNNNCTMYSAASNSEADSVVDFLTVSASNNQYRIKMMAHNKYLSVTTSDDNAYWANSADSYSLWQLEDANAATPEPTPDPVPSEIVNQTFFVKCYGTDFNLNVYGNDTVANNTNVTVYGKENVLAQKWIAKDTPAGPKLFTKINENFCLDIYTPNSNCDMYAASAGDDDTVIEFVPYNSSQKIYRIKMFKHDKYLCADTLSDGGNVSWTSSSSGNTLWQFVTEEDMFPPANPTPSAIKGQEFYLRAGESNCYLNVHGIDTVAVGRNVNVYSKDKCKAQCWIPDDHYGEPRLFTKINKAFGLNIYSKNNPNCTMYTVEGNDEDSVLQFEYVASKQYRIKMHYHNKYLAVAGEITSGANVVWVDSASAATIWTFETETEAFVPAPAAPTAIVDKTCFVRADGTVYYLNVHGSDTVANTRNVDVFTAENCRAQRWIARGTEKDPKLHTAIDETFALNIYKDDCTMYTAAGNDMDSILEFVPVSDSVMKYRIKMFHHNKYLAIDGTPSIGADVIWVDTATAANIWEFIPEEDMDLPEGGVPDAFTADSSLVTTVVPAHTNNFTPDRSVNGSPISEICIHHAAGNITVASLGALWQNPNRAGSSHYGVNGTQIGQYVKESDIAWTNGHWESNKRSVTIETANSSGSPDWLVSDETLNSLIALVADIARRNNLGKLVVGENLTYHSMYSATLCPGPYLKSKLYEIAKAANKINLFIDTTENDLINNTFYIKDFYSNKFINIDSLSNTINLASANDTNGQKWTVKSATNGVKLVSNYKGKTTLNIEETTSDCCIISNTNDSDDLSLEIIPYVDSYFEYSDRVFRIKIKNQSKHLMVEDNKLCWRDSDTIYLWKFMFKEEVVPDIIRNKKNTFKDIVYETYKIDEHNIVNASTDIYEFETDYKYISNGATTIGSKYILSSSFTDVSTCIDKVTVDFKSDGNGSFTVESDVLGATNAFSSFEFDNKDDIYALASYIGNKFPGGEFLIGYAPPISPTNMTLEIVYNVDLAVDDDDIDVEVSFKSIYTITINPSSSPDEQYEFNPVLSPEFAYIAATTLFVICLGVSLGATIYVGKSLISSIYAGAYSWGIVLSKSLATNLNIE